MLIILLTISTSPRETVFSHRMVIRDLVSDRRLIQCRVYTQNRRPSSSHTKKFQKLDDLSDWPTPWSEKAKNCYSIVGAKGKLSDAAKFSVGLVP